MSQYAAIPRASNLRAAVPSVRLCNPPAARFATFLAVLTLAAGSSAQAAPPTLAGCPMFPDDSVWNVPVDTLPVDAQSNAYVATIGATKNAHPDFGTVYGGAPNGIPYVVIDGKQPKVAVNFDYDDESDPGPYPIPPKRRSRAGPSPGTTGIY